MSIELSEGARNARNEYYRQYRVEHAGDVKRIQHEFWERRAKEKYGKNYIPPTDPEELSEQAKELRRMYHAERRKKNPEEGKKNAKNFWERKAKEQ